ncbi:MAG: HEAT repeat domain-containing protein [Pseudobdellovibrio sp.]
MKVILSFILIQLFTNFSTAAIPKADDKSYATQIKMAQNLSLPMSTRWQALIKAAEQAGTGQVAEIATFAKNNDWFMRNAALVALEKINSNYAIDEAKILVQDKALVVRSAAVEMLAKKNTLEIKRIFAAELAKPYNFSGKQSLWIRPQIMKAIANSAIADDRQFIARYLFDPDKKVAAISATALEKLSSVRFDDKNKVEQWQAYVKAKNWL